MKNLKYCVIGVLAIIVLFCNYASAQKNYYLGIESLDKNNKTIFTTDVQRNQKTTVTGLSAGLSAKDSMVINVKFFEDVKFTVLSDIQPTHIEILKSFEGKPVSLGVYPNNIVISCKDLGVLEKGMFYINPIRFTKDKKHIHRVLAVALKTI